MLPARPQRTADSRFAAPAPMTPPVITCVVESGKPRCDAVRTTAAPDACDEKPCGGSILMILLPIGRMIRQPPVYVPSAIAAADDAITQNGTSNESEGRLPCAMSARVMMPIVFWAS